MRAILCPLYGLLRRVNLRNRGGMAVCVKGGSAAWGAGYKRGVKNEVPERTVADGKSRFLISVRSGREHRAAVFDMNFGVDHMDAVGFAGAFVPA